MSHKVLNTKILFDFSKKYFNHPAVFVDVGDGSGRKAEMVGQKFVTLAAFGVSIANTAQSQDLPPMADLNNGSDVTPVFRFTARRLCQNVAHGNRDRHNEIVDASRLNNLS